MREYVISGFTISFLAIFWISGISYGQSEKKLQQTADSLAALLPDRLETIVDKTLDDQFARIENQIAKLPNVDKKAVFLVTLPLENYLEDIYFPANEPAIIYPRIIFRTIIREIMQGTSKRKIALKLVRMEQKSAFAQAFKKARENKPPAQGKK